MLGEIVSGREPSRLVLLEDTIEQCGIQLLECFLLSLAQRYDKVHIFSFDQPELLTKAFPEDLKSRLVHHDGFSDSVGWLQTDKLHVHTDIVEYFQQHSASNVNQKVAVLFSSLTSLLLHRSPPYTCQVLHTLATYPFKDVEVGQVVGFVHSDLCDAVVLAQLRHVASTVLQVTLPDLLVYTMCCHTVHKRRSGKVFRITEQFKITAEQQLQDIVEVKQMAFKTDDDNLQLDPAANLTFSLNLTDKEKETRNQLKLPYMDVQERQPTPEETGYRGRIFYELDVDDFDEEDPDDDLNI